MNRRSIPFRDLEADIEARMQPLEAKRPGRIVTALWFAMASLFSLGWGIGFWFSVIFVLPVAAVWRRVKR